MNIKTSIEQYLKNKFNFDINDSKYSILKGMNASVFLADPEFCNILKDANGTNGVNGDTDFSNVTIGGLLNGDFGNIDFEQLDNLSQNAPQIDQEAFMNILDSDSIDVDKLNELLPEGMKLNNLIGDNTDPQDFADAYKKQKGFDDIDEIIGQQDGVKDLLNQVYANKEVIKKLDIDGDGELSDEEKAKFEDFIRGEGGQLTEELIKNAVDKILDGTFSYDENPEEATTATEPTTPDATDPTAAQEAAAAAGTSGSSGASGSSGSSGGGSGSGGNSGGGNTYDSGNPTSSGGLDSMSLSELEAKKTEKEGELKTAQDGVSAVYSGENENVKQAEQDAKDAKDAYDAALEKDDKVSAEVKQEKADNDSAIADSESKISKLESDINTKENEITAQNSVITSDKSEISALESAISSLNSQSSDDEQTKADIATKKAAAEAKLKEAKAKLEADEQKLQTLEGEKTDLEGQLTTEKDNLSTLETKKSEIEAKILANCSEETKTTMEKYNTARDNINTIKTQELEKAKATAATKQSELDEINAKIDAKKAEETKSEYSPNKYNFDFALTENMTDAQKAELEKLKQTFKEHEAEYKKVEELTGIPAELVCAIHYRESNNNFNTYLHNGDPLGKKTTHVPKGKYFEDWTSAAVDALKTHYKYGQFNKNSLDSWMDFAESYNGYGMKNKGLASSYVYTGTTKYTGGRYVADGKFDRNSYDKRLGIYVICHGLLS
ncbi:hypothetical protein IJ182_10645 [bacterium]|nr:hypothetical protein [bacterium]